jgi:hypothetical protein
MTYNKILFIFLILILSSSTSYLIFQSDTNWKNFIEYVKGIIKYVKLMMFDSNNCQSCCTECNCKTNCDSYCNNCNCPVGCYICQRKCSNLMKCESCCKECQCLINCEKCHLSYPCSNCDNISLFNNFIGFWVLSDDNCRIQITNNKVIYLNNNIYRAGESEYYYEKVNDLVINTSQNGGSNFTY